MMNASTRFLCLLLSICLSPMAEAAGGNGAKCNAKFCPAELGWKFKNNSYHKCDGPVCPPEECCRMMPKCSEGGFATCPTPLSPAPGDPFCLSTNCEEANCCTASGPPPKCDANVCGNGWKAKNPLPTKDCAGFPCTQDECCVRLPKCTSDVCDVPGWTDGRSTWKTCSDDPCPKVSSLFRLCHSPSCSIHICCAHGYCAYIE